jgi:hypothetical protein
MNNRELTVGYAQIYTGCAACDDVIEPGERAYRVDESAKLYCSKTCAASVVPDRIRLRGLAFRSGSAAGGRRCNKTGSGRE